MQTLLLKLLKQQLIAMALEAFTNENMQAVFDRLLTALKVAAVKSGTKVDDWILEMLEKLASDTDAVAKFVELVLQLIADRPDTTKICGDTPSEMLVNQMAFSTARLWAKSAPAF